MQIPNNVSLQHEASLTKIPLIKLIKVLCICLVFHFLIERLQIKAMIKVNILCEKQQRLKKYFITQGKQNYLGYTYVIQRKYQGVCLKVAGKAYFDHPILLFYNLMDKQEKQTVIVQSKMQLLFSELVISMYVSVSPFHKSILANFCTTPL